MGDGTTSPSDAKIEQLVSTGYLKDIPVGGLSTPGFTNNWYIDETRGAALTFIGTDEGARNICQAARKRLGFTDATKSCEAADIAPNDPCCIAACSRRPHETETRPGGDVRPFLSGDLWRLRLWAFVEITIVWEKL